MSDRTRRAEGHHFSPPMWNGRRVATGTASRPRTTADRSRVPFALLVTGLVAGGLSLLLGLNTMSAANELRRHALSEQDTAVAAQVQQLHDDVALSAAPGNLARAAESLGMVPANNPAFLVIGKDGRVRLLGSPAPATAPPLPVIPPPAKKKPKRARHTGVGHPTSTGRAGGTAATGGGANKKKPGKPAPPKTPTPTPTPTPTVTLPGGTR